MVYKRISNIVTLIFLLIVIRIKDYIIQVSFVLSLDHLKNRRGG